jgi:hypothetical protein
VSLHRRAAKRDGAEQAVVKRLRQLGADVYHLSARGIPDLCVVWRGVLRLAEVKTGKGKLTPDQVQFMRDWSGPPIPILTTPDEATTWLLSLRRAAAREAEIHNRTMHTLKTLEEM